jgi:cation diffusion facilitator family transporter
MANLRSGIRAAQAGMLVNAVLAITKLIAGLVGNAYALVADAVESSADIMSSIIVWSGLAIASQPPDEDHPYGHGKAEPLAAAVVSLMLIGAAIAISLEAISEIRVPHHSPAPWTLGVLVGVIVTKWLLSRRVQAVGATIGSNAVRADAFHHLSDALTSAAAFIGISIALVGGPGWESADDWAALLASGIILYNGISMLQPALHDLMDRMPGAEVVAPLRAVAESVPGVLAVEKLFVRRMGTAYRVTIHVQADAKMTLDESHELGARVKYAIRDRIPGVQYVLVHMEPYDGVPAETRAMTEGGPGRG